MVQNKNNYAKPSDTVDQDFKEWIYQWDKAFEKHHDTLQNFLFYQTQKSYSVFIQ